MTDPLIIRLNTTASAGIVSAGDKILALDAYLKHVEQDRAAGGVAEVYLDELRALVDGDHDMMLRWSAGYKSRALAESVRSVVEQGMDRKIEGDTKG